MKDMISDDSRYQFTHIEGDFRMGDGSWIRFTCSSPDLRATFELRVRFIDTEWEAIMEPVGEVPQVFAGRFDDTVCHWLGPIFAALKQGHRIPIIDAA